MKILVLNGPNLNMLGIREPKIYGKNSFADLLALLDQTAREAGVEVAQYQSNHEGSLVDAIQEAYGKFDGIVINPGAYTHTSVAILDALKAVSIPAVEVHISDVDAREPFRQISYAGMACVKTIKGQGLEGYRQAILILKDYLKKIGGSQSPCRFSGPPPGIADAGDPAKRKESTDMRSAKTAFLLSLCVLFLVGCAPAHPITTAPSAEMPAGTSQGSAPATDPSTTGQTPSTTEQTPPAIEQTPATTWQTPPEVSGEGTIAFQNLGRLRLSYTGRRSSIRYVNSVKNLPTELQGGGYDDAFFEEYALVCVVDTANSGSIQISFESMTLEEQTVTVTLSKEMPGDVGTADMATWLLWAQVPKGLEDCQWVLANGAANDGEYADK